MSSVESPAESSRRLRQVADSFARAQRARNDMASRIRAGLPAGDEGTFQEVLAAIRSGENDGPVPLLGRAYRHQWKHEQELARRLEEELRHHPAWPWLRQLHGVAPVALAELCGRLDVTRAGTPSAFWAYCGLATVPGPEPGVRVAQPKPGHGGRPAYDAKAKHLCYLIATSLLRAGGEYAGHYRRERARLDETRPGWTSQRRHLTALRKTEKLFLIHLWIVWRQALGLPITEPFAHDDGKEPGSWIDPWKAVSSPPRRRWSRLEPLPASRHAPA